MELNKQKISKINDIINYISDIEKLLIEENIKITSNLTNNTTLKYNLKNKTHKKKYCRYHKSTLHDSKECYFLKNQDKNKSKNNTQSKPISFKNQILKLMKLH